MHIPGNSKSSHINSLNASVAQWLANQIAGVPDSSTPLTANGYPDEQFKKFYKVQTQQDTIDGFDLKKKQLVVNGGKTVYYNNLFITPFGEIANQSNQGYLATQEDFEKLSENLKASTNIDISIDKLTPKTLEFGLTLQSELERLNQAKVTITYNV